MNNDNYIINLLDLQDENLVVKDITFGDQITIFIEFFSLPQLTSCPRCGSIHYNKHSFWNRTIKHSKIAGQQTIIILKQPRLVCMDCGKTFNVETSFIRKNRRISNSLSNSIIDNSKKKISFKDIAQDSNVSETTIYTEFKKQINEFRCKLTEIVCIDEFKASTIAGKYALIIGDPVSGTILDILPSRQQDYILYYFQTIPKIELNKVKYLVTDLNEAYRSIFKVILPSAVRIADRFHWIRQTTEAFNKMRIRIMNIHIKNSEILTGPEKYKEREYADLLKKNYKLLLANKCSKPSWYFDQIIKTDKYGQNITIQNKIEKCINYDKNLEEGYTLLQELYSIAKYSIFENARERIMKWCDKVLNSDFIIPEMKKAALTYKNWIDEIVNSFIINPITHERMSNGFIEGKNNFCKVIKRVGFGYKDFDVFRNKILNCNRK